MPVTSAVFISAPERGGNIAHTRFLLHCHPEGPRPQREESPRGEEPRAAGARAPRGARRAAEAASGRAAGRGARRGGGGGGPGPAPGGAGSRCADRRRSLASGSDVLLEKTGDVEDEVDRAGGMAAGDGDVPRGPE